MRVHLLLFAATLLTNCTAPPEPVASTMTTPPDIMAAPDTVPLEGWWILTEFHDSILVHHRIGCYRMPVPVWSALMLHLRTDSVDLYGTLLLHGRRLPRHGDDTLLEADLYGPMTLIHEPREGQLKMVWSSRSRKGVLHYRRLQREEMDLVDSLDANDREWHFVKNYHAHLLRTLFVGSFVPLETGMFGFHIDDRGSLSGHPKWTGFGFHDYFGTLHPYANDLDALYFEDPSLPQQKRWLTFNWHYSSDTLILIPMLGNGDYYELGKGEYRYLRRRDG